MDYFAGLDISMDETHVCVLDREGVVVRESKTESTAQAVANELAKAPSCRRIVFETGRMAPILFLGLSQLGFPVICVESRQAYQVLKSLATHKTDRNDARGLAHLARTGFFKPVHVKSLPAHALRSLISARKKLVGQRVTLENQIRGLAVVFGIRLPRAPRKHDGSRLRAGGCAILLLLVFRQDAPAFVALSGLVFFGWGEIFSLFPSTLTDTFGSRNATTNYGFLYIAQGVGSILGGPVAAAMKVATGSWTPVFGVAVAMDFVTVLLALFVLKQMRAAYFGAQATLPLGSFVSATSR